MGVLGTAEKLAHIIHAREIPAVPGTGVGDLQQRVGSDSDVADSQFAHVFGGGIEQKSALDLGYGGGHRCVKGTAEDLSAVGLHPRGDIDGQDGGAPKGYFPNPLSRRSLDLASKANAEQGVNHDDGDRT